MKTETISQLLNSLTQLLADDLSPHSISYQFEKIVLFLRKENIRVENIDCKEYYEDGDLSLILLMKNEALANAQFEQASKFRFIESELLAEKGDNEFTQLKTGPSFFEKGNNCIFFHFNKRKQNERLIANLIEGYNFVHEKFNYDKLHSC